MSGMRITDHIYMAESDMVIVYAARHMPTDVLRIARAQRKRVIFYRPLGCGHLPVPKELKGYALLRVVDGDHAAVVAAAEAWDAE